MCVYVCVSLNAVIVFAIGCRGAKRMPGGFTVPTWLAFNDTRKEMNADDKLICLEKLITERTAVHPTYIVCTQKRKC